MNLFKRRPEELDRDEDNSVEGERDLSSVNKGISLQNKLTNWAVMGAACVLAAVLLYKYYANVYHEYKRSDAPAKDVTRTVGTTTLPPLTMPDPEPVKVAAAIDQSEALPPLHSTSSPPATMGAAQTSPNPVKSLTELVRERRLKREVRFALDGGTSGQAALPIDTRAEVEATASASVDARRAASESTANLIHAAGSSGSRAYLLADPNLMITRGRTIPCTVIPAIDTTLNGIVSCVTSEDVTGADNKVTLMERGTLCVGKQGGGVVQGQRRVGIIWQRCETPLHVLVNLDSSASDSLGRPGISGNVDNHFWDRFGAAVALSLVSDIGPYLVASRQRGSNNTTVAFPTISGPQEIMSEVLKSTVNIAPTITAEQGAQVLIYLADDIDFRDVYQLERMK